MEFLILFLNNPAVQLAILGALTGVAAYIAKTIKKFIDTSLTPRQREILLDVARQAVLVAEQTGADDMAEEKKAKALEVAQTYMEAYGIKVSLAELDAAIEVAVYSELTRYKDPLPEPVVTDPVTPEETPEP